MSLRNRVIKLAFRREDLRSHLLPLLEKHATMQGLTQGLTRLEGVSSAKVISDKPDPYGDREVVIGIYMDPHIGATKGRQYLSGLVRKGLDRVVSKYPVKMVRMLPPRPGLDPFGRPGVNWETEAVRFRKYYAEHPYKLVLEVPGKV